MTVYEHRATVTTASGASASSTLYVPGGLGRQLLIRANTATTLFRADLKDGDGVVRRHYDFHRGEINDTTDAIRLAFVGSYAVEITNASPDDTFSVVLALQE